MKLTILPPSVSKSSRHCGIFNISHRPLQPLMEIALLQICWKTNNFARKEKLIFFSLKSDPRSVYWHLCGTCYIKNTIICKFSVLYCNLLSSPHHRAPQYCFSNPEKKWSNIICLIYWTILSFSLCVSRISFKLLLNSCRFSIEISMLCRVNRFTLYSLHLQSNTISKEL
jgi:hypothetical protein